MQPNSDLDATKPTVVLVPGAWADGTSWARVIAGLHNAGIAAIAAPIPLTTLDDDVKAVVRTINRTEGPIVLAGHAYAGGVIGATKHPRLKARSTSPPSRPTKAKPSPTSSTAIPRTRWHRNSSPMTKAGYGSPTALFPQPSPRTRRPTSTPC